MTSEGGRGEAMSVSTVGRQKIIHVCESGEIQV
jgi:hypothetical protein